MSGEKRDDGEEKNRKELKLFRKIKFNIETGTIKTAEKELLMNSYLGMGKLQHKRKRERYSVMCGGRTSPRKRKWFLLQLCVRKPVNL